MKKVTFEKDEGLESYLDKDLDKQITLAINEIAAAFFTFNKEAIRTAVYFILSRQDRATKYALQTNYYERRNK